jgi:hypothetical protein
MNTALKGLETTYNTVNEEYNKKLAAYYNSTADEATEQSLLDAADDYFYETWIGAYDALE